MAARNWGLCPKCTADALRLHEANVKKIDEVYGKISQEDYLKLVKQAENPVKIEETLREDYDIGVEQDGKFSILYRCSCEKCGFKHSFKYEEILAGQKNFGVKNEKI